MEHEEFQEDLMAVRSYGEIKSTHTLPIALDHRTRALCHEKIRTASSPIPRFIWAALIFLTLLTTVIALPVLQELRSDEALSYQVIFVISLCIQNAVMLFFAPVLIRRYREKKDNWNSNNYGFETF